MPRPGVRVRSGRFPIVAQRRWGHDAPMTENSNDGVRNASPRLVRRDDGKIIAGVCSGLGAYTGIDPVVWRIGFVILGFTTGIGLIAYIVMWLIMPMARPGEPAPYTEYRAMESGRWLGIGAIVLGGIIALRGLFDAVGFMAGRHFFGGGLIWGLLLIGIGIAIWGRDWTKPRPPSGPPGPSGPVGPARSVWASSGTDPQASTPTLPGVSPPDDPPPASTATIPMAATPPSRPSPAVPKPPREPSVLGRLVVGAAALAIGLALMLDTIGAVDLTPRGMLATLVAITGIGLLIGSWRGRARWLIFPGIALALALMIVSMIPFNLRGGWGEIVWSPQTVSEIAPMYEQSAGQAGLDLSDVDFGRRDREIDVRLGFGELYIVLPDEPDVVVAARVQGGEINLFGRKAEGWDVRQQAVSDGDARRAPTITINTRVTFGEVHVLRGTSDDIPGFRSDRFSDRDRFGFRRDN